jgi:hypothetical protein
MSSPTKQHLFGGLLGQQRSPIGSKYISPITKFTSLTYANNVGLKYPLPALKHFLTVLKWSI